MKWLVAIGALAAIGCKSRATPPRPGAIPATEHAIKIDGEWDEEDWAKRALRGQFHGDDGGLARPSSEIRLLHDDRDLLVALYAADENIETTDAFELAIGDLALRVDATAKLRPAISGVRAAVGYDEGTLDNAKDDDEEWVVELAIPIATAGVARGADRPIRAARCDVPKDGVRRCGSWSGNVSIE
jgi:hypothetical protein